MHRVVVQIAWGIYMKGKTVVVVNVNTWFCYIKLSVEGDDRLREKQSV